MEKQNTVNSRFSVYKHVLITKKDIRITSLFIVLKIDKMGTIMLFTDWHKYVKTNSRKAAHRITENSNKKLYYVTKMLNFLFFDSDFRIEKLSDITVEMAKDFMNAYGQCQLPDDGDNTSRAEQSVNRCIDANLGFLSELAENKIVSFRKSDLYKTVEYRTKKGGIGKKRVPVFNVYYTSSERELLRDIPEKVFSVFLNLVRNKYPDILMCVALSAFGGLRPSETCNVRRRDSALGPGIRFAMENGKIMDIAVDLKQEKVLRSDGIDVGGIKKERTQRIYPAFRKVFYELYLEYMDYIEGRKYEADYGPLNINRSGMAMTYPNYYSIFQKAVKELAMILLSCDDAELNSYGLLLQEKSLRPHALRHWFSVKLTLFGEDLASLKYWRGDRSHESALLYLQNKSDLERSYKRINNENFDYSLWKAGKMFGVNENAGD